MLSIIVFSLLESVWSVGLEDGSVFSLTGSVSSSQDGESETVFSVQVWFWSSDLILWIENDSSDDWDGIGWGSVVTSHFLMKLTDGSVQGSISVFLVHVMDSGSWLILQDDSECLDMTWSSFIDFIDWKNLSLSALCFKEPSQMVPEFGLGNDVVSCEQSQSIDFWTGVLFSG